MYFAKRARGFPSSASSSSWLARTLMIANSHATKNPFNPTRAAITASLKMMIPGGSHCVTGTSASGSINKEFILRARAAHPKSNLWNLPAGLRHARNQTLRGELAKRQPRDFEPANERAAAARHFATVHYPRRAGVARKLRQTGVILLRFEFGAERGVFLHRRALAFVAINPGCLCHKATRNLVANFRFSTCFLLARRSFSEGGRPCFRSVSCHLERSREISKYF